MELQYFPMDRQKCTVEIESCESEIKIFCHFIAIQPVELWCRDFLSWQNSFCLQMLKILPSLPYYKLMFKSS